MAWIRSDAESFLCDAGGEFETHRDNPNPASSPDAVEQAIFGGRPFGEAPKILSEGIRPQFLPKAIASCF